jgi:hypothetical protein
MNSGSRSVRSDGILSASIPGVTAAAQVVNVFPTQYSCISPRVRENSHDFNSEALALALLTGDCTGLFSFLICLIRRVPCERRSAAPALSRRFNLSERKVFAND